MGGKSTSTSEPKLNSIPVQSSTLGKCITVGWGRGRVSCNLIDYVGFKATAHTTKTGGKGLGGSYSNTTYTYSASIMLGICAGPIQGVRKIWKNKDVYTDNLATVA